MNANSVQEWEKYWVGHEGSLFGKASRIYRKYILSYHVKRILGLYFQQNGFYVDCGSGSSESSMRLEAINKSYIALDKSHQTLKKAVSKFDNLTGIAGDIFHLPYKSESIAGIYNLGVMEHFNQSEIVDVLNEFHRVLKKDSFIILFWPYKNGFIQRMLDSVTYFLTKICRIKFWYTPEEITRLNSKDHALSIIKNTSFEMEKIYFSFHDLFTHYIVVAKKGN